VDQGALVGSVRIIEFQGDTSVLTIKLSDEGGTEVKAVVEASQQYKPAESVWVQIKPDTIHLFDGDHPVLHRNGSQKS
jgi:ABC-type sugar transport system ATPase subunit